MQARLNAHRVRAFTPRACAHSHSWCVGVTSLARTAALCGADVLPTPACLSIWPERALQSCTAGSDVFIEERQCDNEGRQMGMWAKCCC